MSNFITTKKYQFILDEVNFPIFLDKNEKIISDNILKTGSWESHQLVLYKQLINHKGIFIDIGANVGINCIYSKYIKPDAKIYAIEPSTENFIILKKNIENLKLDIQIFNIALSDKNTSVSFIGHGTNAALVHKEKLFDSSYKVKSLTLDNFIDTKIGKKKIDLVKIDVEGFADLILHKKLRAFQIIKSIILEFSLHDVMKRFSCDENDARINLLDLYDLTAYHYKYKYYLSKRHGPILINNSVDYFEISKIQFNVCDLLFTNTEIQSLTIPQYLIREIQELMTENHRRIIEIQNLNRR
jgi:FkbM family methyltransferase